MFLHSYARSRLSNVLCVPACVALITPAVFCRVIARWRGGVREFPAIVVGLHIHEEVQRWDKKSKRMITVDASPEEAFTYDLKYGDGAIEHDVKADWVTFDQRPNLQPEVRAPSCVLMCPTD